MANGRPSSMRAATQRRRPTRKSLQITCRSLEDSTSHLNRLSFITTSSFSTHTFLGPKRSHAALSEIQSRNNKPPPKRRQTPNTLTPAMSQASQTPSKESSRVATRKAKDISIEPVIKNAGDPSATPQPIRAKGKPVPALHALTVPVPDLDK